MGYLGPPPEFGKFFYQDLTTDPNWGDGVTTEFTMTRLATTETSILVVVGGVVQEPGIGYSLTASNKINLSEAPSDPATTGYIIFLGQTFAMPDNNIVDGNGNTVRTTVSATAPTSPEMNDIWIDTSV